MPPLPPPPPAPPPTPYQSVNPMSQLVNMKPVQTLPFCSTDPPPPDPLCVQPLPPMPFPMCKAVDHYLIGKIYKPYALVSGITKKSLQLMDGRKQ